MNLYDEIVIVGAAGWLGKNILNSIDVCPIKNNGCVVNAIIQSNSQKPDLEAFGKALHKIVVADITKVKDLDFLQEDNGKRLIIHCASVIHPKSARFFLDINVNGTKNLIKIAKKSTAETNFIYISSNSPFGTNHSNNVLDTFDEQSIYNPYMKYGASKMMAENAVLSAANDNFSFCVLRAPWFYGKFQPERQFEFFKMIKNGKVPLVGSGSNLRSMVSVEKLTEAIWLASGNEKARNETFWIADKYPYSMKSIIDTIRRIMDQDFGLLTTSGYLKVPNIVSETAFWVDKGLQTIGLYNQKIHVLSEMNKNIHCSVSKAEKVLGFVPSRTLDDGMKISINDAIIKGKI